ncbi:hypothetical protein [Chitinophaga sp. HK235]|uniref:hypothetical protein n=1 Tax=Chitinophaga sp. HK235 TaxID=2952571 RepID=UPI001BAA4B0C|nr:hypothetical protein [Chitinophaga sp. HK235]
MKTLLTLLLLLCSADLFAQIPPPGDTKNTEYFIDSMPVPYTALSEVLPTDIARASVMKYTGKLATGHNNAVYFETKQFVRNRYWLIFSQDAGYRSIVPEPGADAQVVYILNDKVLKDNPEADLSQVNSHTFKELKVIDKAALVQQYGVKGKKYGVVVHIEK